MSQAAGQVQERAEPTLFGITLFQILVGFFLFFALLHSRRDLSALCLLILGLMGITRLWSAAGRGGLRLAASLDKHRVFPGERLCFRLAVANGRALPLWIEATLSPGTRLLPQPEAAGLTRESGLLWYEEVGFEWQLSATARGVYRVGPPAVRIADPLGFFSREKEAQGDDEIIVYPRRLSLRPLPLPRKDFFGSSGSESPVLDPVHILGTRDYQHSQPARHIHWKASARHDRLQEKVFEPSEQARVLLLLDVRPFAREEGGQEFERTLEAIGSLAIDLDRKGQAFGFATNGVAEGGRVVGLSVARNPQQVPALLELLARIKMEGCDELTVCLRGRLPLPRGLTCVDFAYREEPLPDALLSQILRNKVPLVRVVAHRSSPVGPGERSTLGKVYLLEDLIAAEAPTT